MKIDRGSSAGAQQHRRNTGNTHTERHERSHPLIEYHLNSDAAVGDQGHRQWSAPRPRSNNGTFKAASRPLIDKGRAEGCRSIRSAVIAHERNDTAPSVGHHNGSHDTHRSDTTSEVS